MTDDQWHNWRSEGIGASDVPAIMGVSNFASPWSLWAEKTGRRARRETSQRQRVGQVLEGAIAQLFHEHTGLHIIGEQTWCNHPDLPWALATVDGFVVEHPDQPVDCAVGVGELKTDGAPRWPDGVPERVHLQCQWQMFVTGKPCAWVAVLHMGFRFDVYQVPRNDLLIAELVIKAERFWYDHVQADIPPPVDGSEATHDALADVWPRHIQGKTAHIPADWLVQLADLKEAIKAATVEKDRIDALIREAMGDAEVGLVGGLPGLTLKTQTKRGIDAAALRKDHPDLAARYEKVSEYRVLRQLSQKLRQVA